MARQPPAAARPDSRPSGVHLAEIVAALSLAVDLGLGQPMEHVARATRIACRLAPHFGIVDEESSDLFYLAMLGWVGCIADSEYASRWFGDDVAYRAGVYDVDAQPLPFLGYLLQRAGSNLGPARRAARRAQLVATGARSVQHSLRVHCEVTTDFARRLGLGPSVCDPLGQIFARWDGKGLPSGLGGSDIVLPIRLWQLADVAEVHHRRGGVDAASEVVRARSGTQFDPAVAEAFIADAPQLTKGLDDTAGWDELLTAACSRTPPLTEHELDEALTVFADYADVKAPHMRGHSRGVACLARSAARLLGLDEATCRLVWRAGLVHDLGRTGVPNALLTGEAALSPEDLERLRLHAYYTDRMLRSPPALAEIGSLAALAHERLDGSGYHRGLPAAALPLPARVLAAANDYHVSRENRPHRPRLDVETAASRLRGEAAAGRLDPACADAVLASVGQGRHQPSPRPAGLTPREAQILVMLARGASNRQVASALGVSPKTVSNHVEHVYTKLGVQSRPPRRCSRCVTAWSTSSPPRSPATWGERPMTRRWSTGHDQGTAATPRWRPTWRWSRCPSTSSSAQCRAPARSDPRNCTTWRLHRTRCCVTWTGSSGSSPMSSTMSCTACTTPPTRS